MHRRTLFSLVAAIALGLPLSVSAGKPYADHPSCQDPAIFTRMPGFFLLNPSACEKRQYERYEFLLGEGAKRKVEAVEGPYSYYRYGMEREATPPSALQILRNYQNAARAVGGEMLYENVRTGFTTLRVAKDGKEIWVRVAVTNPRDYNVTMIEREAMKQDVVADAKALGTGLAGSGHVEVPGIFFDTGKADIKPQSEPALAEIAKLLQSDASLKVWVVGHTDSVGSPESNLKLSDARAASVAKALTQKHGVAAARLGAFGAGPYAPVASNAAEEGRAKNRRVELVAR